MNWIRQIAIKVRDVVVSAVVAAYEIGKKVVHYVKEAVRAVVDFGAELIERFLKKLEKFDISIRVGNIEISFKDKGIHVNSFQIGLIEKILETIKLLESVETSEISTIEDYSRIKVSRQFLMKMMQKTARELESMNDTDKEFLDYVYQFLKGEMDSHSLEAFEKSVFERYGRTLLEFGLEKINNYWKKRYRNIDQRIDMLSTELRRIKQEFRAINTLIKAGAEIEDQDLARLEQLKTEIPQKEQEKVKQEAHLAKTYKITSVMAGLLKMADRESNIPDHLRTYFKPVADIMVRWQQNENLSLEEENLLDNFAQLYWNSNENLNSFEEDEPLEFH